MQDSYLPIEMIQNISNYMRNPFIMKLLCKRLYYSIRIYKIRLYYIEHSHSDLNADHFKYVHTMRVSDWNNFDFSKIKCLKSLHISNCEYVDLKECDLDSLNIFYCRGVSGLDSMPNLQKMTLYEMGYINVSCDTLNYLKLVDCDGLVLTATNTVRLQKIICRGVHDVGISENITTAFADIKFSDFDVETLQSLRITDLKLTSDYTTEEIMQLDTLQHITIDEDSYDVDTKENILSRYSDLTNTSLSTTILVRIQYGKCILKRIKIKKLIENIDDFTGLGD